MATINKDITAAIKAFRDNSLIFDKTERYYRGTHDLAFATDKFINAFGTLFREFALNMCPAVVDAVRDKLVVTEFGVEEAAGGEVATEAWRIWQANRMGKRSGEIHKEAIKNGNAYAIVWPDASGKVTIYPNKAANCMVVYDDETPGRVLWAAKYWKGGDGKYRLNLFYPDRVEKYIAKRKAEPQLEPRNVTAEATVTPPSIVLPEAKDFEPTAESPIVRNPYGIVPVFHFANNSDIGGVGTSELATAIPVQDALNKSVLDMLVAMEFAAYRQRWAAGIEIEFDEKTGAPVPPYKAGIERLWITENPDAKFGDFEATDLEQFLKVKESFRVDIAAATGTPLYYLMQISGDFPSGEALKKSETRFINKVRDRMESFGQVWEDVMSFALLIEGKRDVRLFTNWEDPAPLSEAEMLLNLLTKSQIGVPAEQLWMEAGYGEADITKMLAAKAAAADAAARRFNAGDLTIIPELGE